MDPNLHKSLRSSPQKPIDLNRQTVTSRATHVDIAARPTTGQGSVRSTKRKNAWSASQSTSKISAPQPPLIDHTASEWTSTLKTLIQHPNPIPWPHCKTQILSVKPSLSRQQFTTNLNFSAISHVTDSLHLLDSLELEPLTRTVRLAGGQHHRVYDKGRATISTHGPNKFIDNVWYVPSLVDNLLSISKIWDSRFLHVFASKCCQIINCETGEIFAQDARHHASDLYRLTPATAELIYSLSGSHKKESIYTNTLMSTKSYKNSTWKLVIHLTFHSMRD